MHCKKCNANCVKNGFQTNGKQRYYCKLCGLHQQKTYCYKAYNKGTNSSIYKLLINSCGVRDISRVLNISKNTVTRRILKMAAQIKKPVVAAHHEQYEVDELYTHVSGKPCWVIYAINRKTCKVVNVAVGRRTKENLAKVVDSLLNLYPNRIYTDRLTTYTSLIPKAIHCNARFQTNRIERFNLNLRTHLKRLSRKTLCFSKSIRMLEATLRIYFWGVTLRFN